MKTMRKKKSTKNDKMKTIEKSKKKSKKKKRKKIREKIWAWIGGKMVCARCALGSVFGAKTVCGKGARADDSVQEEKKTNSSWQNEFTCASDVSSEVTRARRLAVRKPAHTHTLCVLRGPGARRKQHAKVRCELCLRPRLSLSRQRERRGGGEKQDDSCSRLVGAADEHFPWERKARGRERAIAKRTCWASWIDTNTHIWAMNKRCFACTENEWLSTRQTHTHKNTFEGKLQLESIATRQKKDFFFLRIRFRCESELATTESAHIHVCTRGGRQQRVAVQCYFALSSSTLGFKPSGGDAAVIVVVARTHTHTHTQLINHVLDRWRERARKKNDFNQIDPVCDIGLF